ncbi:SDR family NAD(P)-dependent oxidoreductase [Iodidimonas sp. SYSU 1G8]|uniref:SDR family NAD(P)-dependent oxidoreductase n=1 Tax=Iodidimonas sp. SYSU 1G8 TaxID=3133967 RepID=UPI0031FF41D1
MTQPLSGKTALITGATRGLGRELALALARAGADIAVLGRDEATGEITAQAIRAEGRRALVLAADVTDQTAMEAAAARAEAEFGAIDILVCTAGIGLPRMPVWESDAAGFNACFDVNVLGVLLSLRAVMPGMIARASGRVVVIGGTYGHKGVAGFGVYAASKWALRGLVKSAALDAGPHGVTVNMVAPGGVDGDRLRGEFRKSAEANGETEDEVLARFVSRSALGRLVSGEDVAAAVLHLVTGAGRMMTGQDIVVDAGTIV